MALCTTWPPGMQACRHVGWAGIAGPALGGGGAHGPAAGYVSLCYGFGWCCVLVSVIPAITGSLLALCPRPPAGGLHRWIVD